jgi:hypothetical protein
VIPKEKATGLVPAPNDASDALLEGTRVPKLSLQVTGFIVLYRKCPDVASPFGLPDPLRVAAFEAIAVAADVAAVGAA